MANEILNRASLDAALGAKRFLLFKHSGRCGVSTRSFAEYEAYVSERTDVATGWIDVVNRRELSQIAAQITGVVHKSPQAIWGTKEMLLHARDHTVAEGLEHIATWNAGMMQGSEMAEAFEAKAQKRAPVYQNLPPRKKGL